MIKTIILVLLGILIMAFAAGMAWLAIPGCQTNHLIVTGQAPPNDVATIRFGEQVVWSGNPAVGAKIDFIIRAIGSTFTVTTPSGQVATAGYVEPLDGWLHIIRIDGNTVGYDSEYRGFLHHGRDAFACWFWPGPGKEPQSN